MSSNDTQILTEAYSKMLIGEGKALTPEQIAKNAQPAGSTGKKGPELAKNKDEDKDTTKTLEEVPYTDQHADNFDQDGVDTKVKDRFTLKEADAVAEFYGTKKKLIKEDDAQPPVPNRVPEETESERLIDELCYETAMHITGMLEELSEALPQRVKPEDVRKAKLQLAVLIKRLADDFRFDRLPNDLYKKNHPEGDDPPPPHPKEIDDTPGVPPATPTDRDASGMNG